MSDYVRLWLAKNRGVPLREEIVELILNAVNDDLDPRWEKRLKEKIALVPR